jgi:membrane-associated phospholipid phosphatase
MLTRILRWDAQLSEKVRLKPGASPWFKLAAFLAHSGDSWFWMIGLGMIWLLTQGEWHNRAALLAAGIAGLAFVVLGIKFSIRRRRPEGDWGAIYRNTDPHSFPSGHATRAFFLIVMAFGLGPAWFGWLILVWAPIMSLARVMTGVHYLSDVVAGMVLGLLAGVVMLQINPLLMAWFPFMFNL